MNRSLTSKAAALLSVGMAVAFIGFQANAAEIRCFFADVFRESADVVIPQFEKSSGNKVTIEYGLPRALIARIEKGDAPDIVILTSAGIKTLEQEGKLVAGSEVEIGRLGIGAFVRKGAPKPDLSSVDAFTRALLSSKGIAYIDPALGSPSGIYMASLMERLGIAAQMKAKTKFAPSDRPFEPIVRGDADMTFILISGLDDPTAEFAGSLPASIQNYTAFTAALAAGSAQQTAGKALIAFLTSPTAVAVMKARHFEPASEQAAPGANK